MKKTFSSEYSPVTRSTSMSLVFNFWRKTLVTFLFISFKVFRNFLLLQSSDSNFLRKSDRERLKLTSSSGQPDHRIQNPKINKLKIIRSEKPTWLNNSVVGVDIQFGKSLGFFKSLGPILSTSGVLNLVLSVDTIL